MLQDFIKEIQKTVSAMINEVHTSIPARLVDIDAGTGKATVKPYGKLFANGTVVDYPLISGVPILTFASVTGAAGIVFPVSKGDDCLLIMSEEDISAWLEGGEQELSLKYDLSNAIALVGLTRTAPQHFDFAVDGNSVLIYSDISEVKVTPTSVNVHAAGTTITVDGGGATIKGNVSVSGNLSVSGNISYGSLS